MTISVIYLVTFHPIIFRLRVFLRKKLFLENKFLFLESKILFLEDFLFLNHRRKSGQKSTFG
jgi:hypothetical protein